jgi:hypothetical protein
MIGYVPIDFACSITQSTIIANSSGTCEVVVFKGSAGAIPATSATCGSFGLSSSQYGTQGVSGWNCTSCTAGDIIGFNLVSNNGTCGIISVSLKIQ